MQFVCEGKASGVLFEIYYELMISEDLIKYFNPTMLCSFCVQRRFVKLKTSWDVQT